MPRPDLNRVPEYFHAYINQVPETELIPALSKQTGEFITFLQQVPSTKRDYRYSEGKWSIKQILQHIIDAERVFSYRALSFARKDSTPLPGFDENAYADNAKTNNRDWNDLVGEFKALRTSTEILFHSFDEEQLESEGIASGNPIYVRAIGFIMVGHINHHVRIIRERYLTTNVNMPDSVPTNA